MATGDRGASGTEKIDRHIRTMAARFSLAETVSYKYRTTGPLTGWGTGEGKPWPLRTQVKHTWRYATCIKLDPRSPGQCPPHLPTLPQSFKRAIHRRLGGSVC